WRPAPRSARNWPPVVPDRPHCWPGRRVGRRSAPPCKPRQPALERPAPACLPHPPASVPHRQLPAPYARRRSSHNRPASRLQERPATMRYVIPSAFCTPFVVAPTPVAKLTPAALKSSRYYWAVTVFTQIDRSVVIIV